MNIFKIKINVDSVGASNGFVLSSVEPYYMYTNGLRTDKVEGVKYKVVIPKMGYEFINVKVKGSNKAIVSQKEIDEANEIGKPMLVDFEGFRGKLYQINGKIDVAFKADKVIIKGAMDFGGKDLYE